MKDIKVSKPKKVSKPRYGTFEAVYTSGLTIDSSLLTALCLIFDKIHILNNLEFAIELSKNYKFETINAELAELARGMEILPADENYAEPNPLSILNEEQAFTAKCYLSTVFEFGLRYDSLFEAGVINCSLFKDNQPIKVKPTKKGKPGELNTYEAFHNKEELNRMVESGKVPILGYPHVKLKNAKTKSKKFTAPQLAYMLALRPLNLVLPQTKSVDGETILEAREKLEDCTLPFWSSMFYLTDRYKYLLDQNISDPDIERECDFIIDTYVRPNLIDLNQKITKERKGWFGKIVTPVVDGVKIFAAKPSLTTTDLLTTAVAAGADIALDTISESTEPDTSPKKAGLTLLIELEKYPRNKKSG